ncbi:MAG TPA: MotA/TolQ/ExbB proton channel family protein [Leptospiraceae bacterium]|jgi:biopolymer transport protein ExbB/TolQ|nr:MotA/TolQ/ExbB proton channel family protein [Leptospirales bacterium]HMU83446.1 MotA/TolQ/ExbB proton channel family protein [Leptospiraceae bacterium]HMW59474.1 MotA/TolQ/ExbB proton channel family protein [Leptospiraceae bacterium]HMX57877.1 MotA/TolQ/ExbB proton channel family protein [Leptospiraceae bacterium]HMY46872.1 MotA/TolQ/ExbB proton channel family protein [Leptospiraceae bacterium]
MFSLQWSDLIRAGGPTLFVLLICFIATCILIIERSAYFRARARETAAVLEQLRAQEGSTVLPRDSYKMVNSPVTSVLYDCYPYAGGSLFEEVKSRAIAENLPSIERYLGVLATLGTVSPYIGLLGTVFGIIRAFASLGSGPAADAAMSGLNAGIAESLVATAAGLFVAIPATISFNLFRRSADDLVTQLEIAASRLRTLLERSK